MLHTIARRFESVAPAVDAWSFRIAREEHDTLMTEHDVLSTVRHRTDAGAMITVRVGRGQGYAATSDLSDSGLKRAAQRAVDWARASDSQGLYDHRSTPFASATGSAAGPTGTPWESVSLAERVTLLLDATRPFQGEERFVDWTSGVWATELESLLITSAGGELHQHAHYIAPTLRVIASHDGTTVFRSLGRGTCRQGGLEAVLAGGLTTAGPRIAREARELLEAPNCPTGRFDIVLSADQMMLRIHESIGHPLELDRILGDERNFAGTSFVTREMFGSYRYGSDLLNITFDPTRTEQFASYRWDDEGTPATREYLIRDGILERGIGGATSQERSGIPGVAAARTCRWNRPAIDRMANINLECGTDSLASLIGGVERGIYMETNLSWSIDDSRNKFQFGTEYARLIENGELGPTVKKPNYRGVSANFWRQLDAVGDSGTHQVLGTPFCGKGEPNQVIRVGHATPACRFTDIDVFGGV